MGYGLRVLFFRTIFFLSKSSLKYCTTNSSVEIKVKKFRFLLCRSCYSCHIKWTYIKLFSVLRLFVQSIFWYNFMWYYILYWHEYCIQYTMLEIRFDFFSSFFFKTDQNLLLLFFHTKLSSFFEHHECIKQISFGINQLILPLFISLNIKQAERISVAQCQESDRKSPIHSLNTVCCLYDY